MTRVSTIRAFFATAARHAAQLKLRRKVVNQRFVREIDELFREPSGA
ncbi:MAG TPA: hypothetical protein VG496_05050 [Myxococcales bacterium]|nr:hypothetical protein [Myxococcales bacterium]